MGRTAVVPGAPSAIGAAFSRSNRAFLESRVDVEERPQRAAARDN
jgi:hypothetical protein